MVDLDVYDNGGAALSQAGGVFVWGLDLGDEYADGLLVSTVPAGTPREIPGLNRIVQVEDRGDLVLARDSSGAVWWWGTFTAFDA